MVLLNDEKIRSVNGDTRGPDQRERNITKAQLKQVVEWLEQFHVKVIEGDPSDLHARISDCGYRLSVKDVQALKKEVE